MEQTIQHQKNQYIWNSIGTIASTLLSTILLLVATRFGTSEQADLFGIAYTVAQQLLVVGLFGVRNYQATDVTEENTFSSYLFARFLTILLMGLLLAGYLLLGQYALEKVLVITFMTLYRACDAFSDVYQGFFQQHVRSDLAGKILFFRSVVSGLLFTALLLTSHSLLVASSGLFMSNFFLTFVLDFRMFSPYLKTVAFRTSWGEIVRILRSCFAIFINIFLINYIFSEPKLVIDALLENGQGFEGMQRDFNVLFMPTFVLALLFLLVRPLMTDLSLHWHKGQYSQFSKQVRILLVSLLFLSICILIGGYFLALPILGFLFNLDLMSYQTTFLILLVGGCFNLFAAVIDSLLTIFRKQYYLLVASIVAFLVSKGVTTWFIVNYGMLGASVSFLLTMSIYFCLCLVIFIVVKRKLKNE